MGHHSTEISPLWILSVTKIYLMFICLVRLLLNDLTIFSRRIALFLSWYMMFSVTPQPWYYKKFLVQEGPIVVTGKPFYFQHWVIISNSGWGEGDGGGSVDSVMIGDPDYLPWFVKGILRGFWHLDDSLCNHVMADMVNLLLDVSRNIVCDFAWYLNP